MQMKFIIEGSQKKLRDEIEKKIAEGWERHGDVLIVEPNLKSDVEVPKFLRFWQTMTKER